MVEQLKKCTTPPELESIYASMIKKNADQHCFLMNQFLSVCNTLHLHDLACSSFSQMQSPNIFVYNAIIRGSVHSSSPVRALRNYTDVLRADLSPNSYTFSSLIKACSMLHASFFGESIHGSIWKFGWDSHVFVQTALIDFYSNIGRVLESQKVFNEMSERDSFAWTTMVSAHARAGDMNYARKMFDEMPERNIATWNTMIDGYARSRDTQSAEILFAQMPARDTISWTTMITCYSLNKRFQEAVTLFQELTAQHIIPDEMTLSIVVSACAHLGSLEIAKETHQYILQNRFKIDVYIGSALIDMYAKCGSMERSLVVFYKLREKSLFCWNALIEGLSVHGHGKEALSMFSTMIKEKMVPNSATFISILCACSHGGLVEEGRSWFLSMSLDYGISPRVEHYGCMVDMLSKVGLIEEAMEVIQSMKLEPNAVIWGALLGGCKIHKNLKIAHIAVDELKILEPKNSGYYMLLMNMYAEANRWREVAEMRGAMKRFKVEKQNPGSSWVEVDGKICLFAATDMCHHDSDKIVVLLNELDRQLKLSSSNCSKMLYNF